MNFSQTVQTTGQDTYLTHVLTCTCTLEPSFGLEEAESRSYLKERETKGGFVYAGNGGLAKRRGPAHC